MAPCIVGAGRSAGPTVLMNRDAPILLEAIKYHQSISRRVRCEVEDIVRNTYGEVAVCKVAHSQKLVKHVPEEDLDSVIAPRLR